MAEPAPRPVAAPGRRARLLPLANVLAAQLSTAAATAGAFVITPALINALGESAYGVWLLITSMVGYMRMLDLGIATATMKYGAGAYERGDRGDLAKVFDTTSAAFLTIGALCAGVTLGLSWGLPRLYPVLAGQETTILLLGGAMTVELSSRTYAAALRTRSLFVVSDSVEVVTYSAFKFGLVLYFASRGLDLRLLSLLSLLETTVRNAVVIASALTLCPFARRLDPRRADRGMLRKLAGIGGAVSIIQVADLVRFQLDAAVIAWFIPSADAISIFGIGARLPSIAFFVVGVIGAVMVPRFSGLSERGGDGLIPLLRRVNSATGLLSSYIFVNLGVLGPGFLALWLKRPWVAESSRILLMLLPAYYVTLIANPSANLLVARGQLRGQTKLHVTEAAANFLLSVLLVRWFGIYGVALGTIVPMLIVRGVVFPLLLKAELGLAPSAYWGMHARALGIGLVYLVAIVAFARLPLTTYLRFFSAGIATTAIYLAVLLAAVPEARAWVLQRVRRSEAAEAG